MAERTRVLFVVHSLATGGIERLLWLLARGLPPAAFELHACCLVREGEAAPAFRSLGVAVTTLRGRSTASPSGWLANGAALAGLVRLVREVRPRVLQAEMFFAGTMGRLAAAACRVPVVVHGVHNYYPWKGRLATAVDRWLARSTTALVTPTAAVARWTAAQLSLPEGRFAVIPNGVPQPSPDTPPRARARALLSLEDGAPVLAFCGRLVPQKRPELAFEAFARLPGAARLLVIGDGELRAGLEARARQLGVADRVLWTGRVDDPYPALRAADLLVMPSEREGFGLAAGEALLAGVPVLLQDLEPLREAYGFLGDRAFVASSDPGAWAAAAEKRIQERDPKSDAAFGRVVGTRFPPEQMVARYGALYGTATTSASSSA